MFSSAEGAITLIKEPFAAKMPALKRAKCFSAGGENCNIEHYTCMYVYIYIGRYIGGTFRGGIFSTCALKIPTTKSQTCTVFERLNKGLQRSKTTKAQELLSNTIGSRLRGGIFGACSAENAETKACIQSFFNCMEYSLSQ